MPTALSMGYPQTMTQNEVYALPACNVRVLAEVAIEHSVQVGAGFVALTGSETVGAETSGGFVRCTTGNCIVNIKKT